MDHFTILYWQNLIPGQLSINGHTYCSATELPTYLTALHNAGMKTRVESGILKEEN